MIRIGQGFDVHAFAEDRKLILAGVEIPHKKGLLGHSDADVVLHAVCDALLGALALGDIGKHFPDTDPHYKNADSRHLLRAVYKVVTEKAYCLGNLDITIIAQAPKLAPYILAMRQNLSADLSTILDNISVKAKTTERLGFTGREEGIAAEAVVLLEKRGESV